MVEKKLFDLDKLIEFRRHVHQYPELAFEEFNTSAKIVEYLKSIGIVDSQIRRIAKTGLTVDIKGKAEPSGSPYMIAFRADMDCLPIKELADIDYRSKKEDRSHMCGHDGHCAWLLGAASKILENLDKIPSDKTVRLLFQPAEEALGGAFPMIQEGCLQDVNEVYGAHCEPWGKTGEIYIKDGPIQAQITEINITIFGKGGHICAPETFIDPLPAAIEIYHANQKLIESYGDAYKNRQIVAKLPYLHCGEVANAIHDRAVMKGDMRSFSEELTLDFKSKFQTICEKICQQHDVKLQLELETSFPAVINSKKETEVVIKIGKEVYGEDKVSDTRLPNLGAEDFSFYTRYLPGAYFFLTTGLKETENPDYHSPHFVFDDSAIEKASELFYKIALHQFGVIKS
mmetsp:Transcript_30308/g.34971  ORF Transcript_30308/g.34971 Transcript_30308/m.34971 type:complete len:400 (+) Transcript_30308:14-1213(+)|eukprot:CAMPEP_0176420978 /NCGR_PEP_ID=MMETSP0127-20121128/8912_1 /TAXON_ID=938130 /ORGANISM="Platyophrya macrostoma, Strain WH" /LENGTH=399 /DNA_ID=CAMNT_0017801645 /DNA_START=14 /DNA_END=1213 /DNA_ORIENTATION=-